MRIIVRLLDPQAGNDVIWASRFDRETGRYTGSCRANSPPRWPPRSIRNCCFAKASAASPTGQDHLRHSILPCAPSLQSIGLSLPDFVPPGTCLRRPRPWTRATPRHMRGGPIGTFSWSARPGQQDPGGATRRAGELAERAVTLDPGDARALALVGHVRGFLHKRAEEACALHERALSLNPNLPMAWCFSGLAHCYLGRHEMAIEHIARAQHLSPHDPHAFFFDMALMMPYFLRGEFEKALASRASRYRAESRLHLHLQGLSGNAGPAWSRSGGQTGLGAAAGA